MFFNFEKYSFLSQNICKYYPSHITHLFTFNNAALFASEWEKQFINNCGKICKLIVNSMDCQIQSCSNYNSIFMNSALQK